ncbi:hypothetical protein Gogos_003263 [Gossypium gossypioides]|uniref:Uncharacterized protein n=1 Tax=Gossypium gossypioides TaxID=34282 RepID=A0A7J9CLU0_GOSGO|nr:hypothetical protein [Gossypium gossypioides]
MHRLILVIILTLLFSHKHKILHFTFLFLILCQVRLLVIHHLCGTRLGHLIFQWRRRIRQCIGIYG